MNHYCDKSASNCATFVIDKDQVSQHLAALGYQAGDTIYLRSFYPSDDPRKTNDKGRKAHAKTLDEIVRLASKFQKEKRGVYLVVNGGGHLDKEVPAARAIFYEHDDLGKEVQAELWQHLELPEPTLQVDTGGKSIHSYWVFDTPIPVQDWRSLQADLLEFADGDPCIKNPSRVMRLAGCWHSSGNQSRIIRNSGQRYNYEQLRKVIPSKQSPEPRQPLFDDAKSAPVTSAGDKTDRGIRYDDIQVPVPGAIPLVQCLSKESRMLVEQGVSQGGRNQAGAKLARDLIGAANYLQALGQPFIDLPEVLFDNFAMRCNPPLDAGETQDIWRKAKSANPTPSCSEEGVNNCIKGWYWNNHVKPHQVAPVANLPTTNAQNRNQQRSRPQKSCWNAPATYDREIGYWVEDRETGEYEFYPKCNFDFEVVRELSSGDGGGLAIEVERSIDPVGEKKRVILHSTDYSELTRFVDAVKVGLGYGIVCNLKKEQLGVLIAERLREYRAKGGRKYRLSEGMGQQADGTWVFSDCQFTKDGEPTTEEESGWIYNSNIGEVEKMPEPEILPHDPQALPRLVRAMQKFHGSGIYPALFVLGYVAAGVHYQEIMHREKGFPLLNLLGDPGSNKSISADNALSLVGWHNNRGKLHRTSISATYETLKLAGSLPLCLDDPVRSRELDELLKGLYNGLPRKVRGNFQVPHTTLMVCSNHAIGDEQPATLSRLIQVPFYRLNDGDKSAWDEMQVAQRKAAGAFVDLIKLGYPTEQIRALQKELRQYLGLAHQRIGDSMGIVSWYTLAICRLAGFSELQMKQYIIQELCKLANDAESNTDSLADFVDKLSALQSESLVGQWSVRIVESSIGKALAVNMSSVWPVLDRVFQPIYSRKVIEALVEKAGGQIRSTQRFHRSKDESLTWQRMVLQAGVDATTPEPETVTRRCILIPLALATRHLDDALLVTHFSSNLVTDVNKNQNPCPEPVSDCHQPGTECKPSVNDVNQPQEEPESPGLRSSPSVCSELENGDRPEDLSDKGHQSCLHQSPQSPNPNANLIDEDKILCAAEQLNQCDSYQALAQLRQCLTPDLLKEAVKLLSPQKQQQLEAWLNAQSPLQVGDRVAGSDPVQLSYCWHGRITRIQGDIYYVRWKERKGMKGGEVLTHRVEQLRKI
jgi:hypothetical protein